MECKVMVNHKLGSVPIMECGGVVLQHGDKLLVTPAVAVAMKRHYGTAIIEAGTAQKETLRGGHYEYVSGGAKAVSQAAAVHVAEAPAVEAVSTDKSMSGKSTRVRRKG